MKTMYAALLIVALVIVPVWDTVAQNRHKKDKHKSKKKVVVVHKPAKKYKKLPARNAIVVSPPKKHTVIRFGGKNFYHSAGVFYIKSGSSYRVARAPIGLRITNLPPAHIHVVIGSKPYYYYYGSYYVPVEGTNQYEVVAPPKGALVDALPEGYEEREIDGRTYYYFDDTYYKAVIDDTGKVMYEVV